MDDRAGSTRLCGVLSNSRWNGAVEREELVERFRINDQECGPAICRAQSAHATGVGGGAAREPELVLDGGSLGLDRSCAGS